MSRVGEMSFTTFIRTSGSSGGPTAAGSTKGSAANLPALDNGSGSAIAPASSALTYGRSYGQQPQLPQPSQHPSRQASSLSQASSQSQSQRQESFQTRQQPMHPATLAAKSALYGAADPSAPPLQPPALNLGSLGMRTSPSGGSLVRYEMGADAASEVPGPENTMSQGSLLMAGPGSLCARLPRYVRYPPIEAVVFGWGVTEDGQLGVADRGANLSAPKVVESLLGIQFSGRGFCRTPLVAGSRNTLALDAAGQVWSFGWNDRGTLGHGHRDKVHKPQRVAALKGIRVAQVAIGGWHCLALSDRGTMFAWGGNEYGQCGSVVPGQRDIVEPLPVDLGLGPHQRVRQVSAGGMHSLALLEDGTVWQWGENWGDFSMCPVRTPRPVPGAVAVAAVACGAFHNLLLTASGRVYSWGMNDYGQLGNGSTTYSTAPRPVLDMDGVVVADIAAGGWHSCALSSAGEVLVWGRGEYGRLGLGDRSGSSKLRPQKVRGLESHVVVQVAAGGSHTMALTSTARLFVWGRGAFGRLGLGGQGSNGNGNGAAGDANRDCYHPVECALPGGTERWRVAAIGAGGRHSLVLAIPVRDPGGSAASSPDLDDPAMEDDLAGPLPLPLHPIHTRIRHPHLDGGVGGGGGHRQSSDEYDVDGYSEPSLYDRDMSYDPNLPEAVSPQRFRRSTAASGLVSVDGAIRPISVGGAMAPANAGGTGDDDGNGAAGPAVTAAGEPRPTPPDLRPPAMQDATLLCSPSMDTLAAPPPTPAPAGLATVNASGVDAEPDMAAPPPPPQPTLFASEALIEVGSMESVPPSRGSAESGYSSGGATPSPPPPSVASGASTPTAASSVAATAVGAPRPPSARSGSRSAQPYTGTGSSGGAVAVFPAAGGSGGGTPSNSGAAAGALVGALSPAEPRSGPGSPSSSTRILIPTPPQALSPLPPAPPAVSYGMRRSGSAVGPLSQLAQILPEPAAVAAAALLDADSDLAPPRGLAAAAAAAAASVGVAVSTGASRPSSAHGSGGPVSRGGSVTGMRFGRTVFGGGGEEEDEAMQAAEAAEAAAEELDGSGEGEEDELDNTLLDNAQDDTDEDQGMYDSSGAIQHPRSPSLMQRPLSPSIPLSPHRHAAAGLAPGSSAAVHIAGGGTGGTHRVLSPSPSMTLAGGATVALAGLSGSGSPYAGSGSPSGRALLSSYGSPRVPLQ